MLASPVGHHLFISLDPLRYNAGYSDFYIGIGNNPVTHTDPSGEFLFTAGVIFAVAVGAVRIQPLRCSWRC